MAKGEKQEQQKKRGGALDKLEPGGDLGPIEDRNQYEQHLNDLPPDQRELTRESARLADVCQYFSQQRMDIPPETLDQIGGLSRLQTADRIRALKDINQALMEYLNRVGKGPQIRQ